MLFKTIIFLFFYLLSVFSFADEANENTSSEFITVVKAAKFSASSKKVITQKQIENSHYQNLTDLLQAELNIPLVQSSFEPTSLYFRGGPAGQVLILINGVPYYDPTTIQATVDLSAIPVSMIKRIEFLYGAQSVLYGSSAQNGVIAIETFNRELVNSQQEVSVSSKLNQSRKNTVNSEVVLSSQNKLTSGHIFYAHVAAANLSQLSVVENSQQIYPQRKQDFQLGYLLNNFYNGNLDFTFTHSLKNQNLAQTNNSTYVIVDTQNYLVSNQIDQVAVNYTSEKNIQAQLSLAQFQRQYSLSIEDDVNNQGVNENYKGYLGFAQIKKNILNTSLGIDFKFESLIFKKFNQSEIDQQQSFTDLFLKQQNLFDISSLEAGVRYELKQNSNVISQLGYEINFLKFELATGFKNSSLYQKYSTYGNSDLKTEESFTASSQLNLAKMGFDFFNLNALKNHQITFYYSKYKNLINTQSQSPYKYENIDSVLTKGLEYSLSLSDFDFMLSYQEPYDQSHHRWLLRRPFLNSSLVYHLFNSDKLQSDVQYVYSGSRHDLDFSTHAQGDPVTLNSYSLVNFNVNYQVQKDLNLFSRIDNILNQTTESVYGYKKKQVIYQAGLKYLW